MHGAAQAALVLEVVGPVLAHALHVQDGQQHGQKEDAGGGSSHA